MLTHSLSLLVKVTGPPIGLRPSSVFIKIDYLEEYTINSLENPDELAAITNDLKIIESSATKIVFFLDGTIEESYIITSSNDGKTTNTFRINVIGKIDYDK